jgi:MFS transporter, MHS family, shikimate and dehydroshikimate transport protein
VVENTPIKSRGLLGSMVQLGYPIGNLAAIGALTVLSQLPEAVSSRGGGAFRF